jgi:hypothetical protein
MLLNSRAFEMSFDFTSETLRAKEFLLQVLESVIQDLLKSQNVD